MGDKETTTDDTSPTTNETDSNAAEEQGFGGMCRGLPEMGREMMTGGMPDCCRPGAPKDPGGSEEDKVSSV